MLDSTYSANIFKALADENRIAILKFLQSGEKCACMISAELDIAQSKLSYHMKILCDSNLVESWYVGKWTHYKLSKNGFETAISILNEFAVDII